MEKRERIRIKKREDKGKVIAFHAVSLREFV